jgi:DNA-binding MarR family transcriptional regulator/GNAT superfamily N-acetyltransferase
MRTDEIALVRQFNRLVTQRVGALDDHFLGRDRPLGASRLLYEIGERGANLRDLRGRLGLDAGYISRLSKALAKEGLIRLKSHAGDQRVRTARLTARGRRELRELNQRSDRRAADLLHAVPASRRERLVAAMREVQRLLRAAGLVIERVDPVTPAARWCWTQYFAELDRRFPGGFNPGTSLSVEDRDFIPPRGSFLVASIDGETVAGGCLKKTAPRVGWLKRMWVAESARGLGIGRRLLEALETEARGLGITLLQLETNKALHEAIAMYRSAGYRAVAPFNAEPYATHWFAKRLSRTRSQPT